MRRVRGTGEFLIGLLVLGLATGCDDRRGRGEQTPEEDDDDDSSAAVGDDDDAVDDDDFEWEGDPVLLATYDFTLVIVKNELSNQFAAIHGQMDVSVTDTQFLAEMRTADREWDWFGSLLNTTSFDVHGAFLPPGADETIVRVRGNFQENAGQVDGSNSCLTGIGKDDDPNLGTVEGRYIEFTWYACRQDASPAARDRTGSYTPIVSTVHWDACNAWASWPSETWSFVGRNLVVTTQRGDTGWGVISDDGQLFRYTILESENPGRSIKVIGDFESTTQSQANGHGYCGDGAMAPDARINLDGY
jgi:hypothetical protein